MNVITNLNRSYKLNSVQLVQRTWVIQDPMAAEAERYCRARRARLARRRARKEEEVPVIIGILAGLTITGVIPLLLCSLVFTLLGI